MEIKLLKRERNARYTYMKDAFLMRIISDRTEERKHASKKIQTEMQLITKMAKKAFLKTDKTVDSIEKRVSLVDIV
jgi:hypothetical protein